MPRLPSAEDLGQRPTPVVRGNISRLNLTTPRQGAEAQAETQFGQAVAGLGNTLGALAARDQQRVDEARAEDAFSQYQDKTLDLEYGDEGFTKILGGDAVKQPMIEDYKARRETIAGGIRDSLDSDAQKTAFDNRARIVDRQFDARIYRHKAEQTNVYQDQTSEGVMATERKAAALNYDQPGQIEMSILRTNMELDRQARLKGLPPDTVSTMKTIAQTQIHADVMNQMLSQGRDSAAAAYYTGVKDQLTPEAVVLMGAKTHAASIDGDAIRGADVIWSAAGPQSVGDNPRPDVLEQLARDKFAGKPQEMKAVIADLRSRVTAHKDGQQEYKATNEATVLGEFNKGADLKTLQSMPEYQALDGDAQTKLSEHFVDWGWTQQQRARAESQYREGAKKTASLSTYWELSNPQVLNSLSENQILALEPTVGSGIMDDLMKAKRKLNSPENVKAATIDAELFNTVASDAGLKPYDKQIGADQKEYLGRLKNETEAAIDMEQRRTGTALNREQKEKMMRSMVDKKVMVSHWSGDLSLPAPSIRPEQRSKIFVPIEAVDGAWLKGALNYLRSTGAVPAEWNDAVATKKLQGRLQRAYAISITGGTSDEGKKALEGTDQ